MKLEIFELMNKLENEKDEKVRTELINSLYFLLKNNLYSPLSLSFFLGLNTIIENSTINLNYIRNQLGQI